MAARKAPAAKTITNDRNKALEVALSQIDKQFGKGSVMRLGDDNRPPVQVIPTGSLALDVALGIGGLPRGRVIEIYGPESSGKTTVALHAVASAQKAGGNAAFIDAEHALDPVYARALGVDTDSLLVSQPDTGEQALEIADMLIRSGGIDIIVIDSVAALVPKAEIEGEMGDSHVGLQARLMSQALRKITGALSATGTTAISINQLREKIGVFFGSPETTTGGKALKFYASVRIDVRRIETLKEAGAPVGNRTRAKVVKNKMAPPFSRPSSISFTARESRARAPSSTWASRPASCESPARGSPTGTTSSVRVRRMSVNSWQTTPSSRTRLSRRSCSRWESGTPPNPRRPRRRPRPSTPTRTRASRPWFATWIPRTIRSWGRSARLVPLPGRGWRALANATPP